MSDRNNADLNVLAEVADVKTGPTILGIRFFSGTARGAVSVGMKGGLVVIPSAPVLVRMTTDAAHREALLNADMAIADSGLMVLSWRLIRGEKLVRISGLEYLILLQQRLRELSGEGDTVAWVMPTVAARDRNLAWLRANGHMTKTNDFYVAPVYPPNGLLSDSVLLAWVRSRQPQHIIICLGGGVQERLGYFLKQELERGSGSEEQGASKVERPGIHCVGAAIGFLSGDQVRIPMWADYLYLGWLFRCISAPRRFVPRYFKAARLLLLLWRYGKDAPSVTTAHQSFT